MSLDVVELALDELTDGFLFEKIASEIIRDEGFPNIIRLGGSGDFGMDAICNDVFYGYENKIVFQFTTEDYVLGKMRDTVEKLRKKGIQFTELRVVTTCDLTTHRIDDLTLKARKEYDITAICMDRKTLVNRLADFANGIFVRHFPSIDSQLAMLRSKPSLTIDDNERESALLKITLVTSNLPDAKIAKKTLVDQIAIGVLASEGALSASQIGKHIQNILAVDSVFNEEQIRASIKRLGDKVTENAGKYSISTSYKNSLNATTVSLNKSTAALISDIVEIVCIASGENINPSIQKSLRRNAKDILIELLRTLSAKIASKNISEFRSVNLNFGNHIHRIAVRNVPLNYAERLCRKPLLARES